MRIINAFKLNPYEQLNLRFDVEENDIRKQFRKLSVLVHPDKCSHPRAKVSSYCAAIHVCLGFKVSMYARAYVVHKEIAQKHSVIPLPLVQEAFELLGFAVKALTSEEETLVSKRTELVAILKLAKEDVLKNRTKVTKTDVTVKVAAMVHADGRAGVDADWEKSDEFHLQWLEKGREYLARAEFRKRKVAQRCKDEDDKAIREDDEEKQKAKIQKKHEKAWASSRDERVSSWRDFKSGAKKPKGTWKGPAVKGSMGSYAESAGKHVGKDDQPPKAHIRKKGGM